MYWKTDNKGVLSIIMAAGEEGWERYRDHRQEGERDKNATGEVSGNSLFSPHKNAVLVV